MKTYFFKYYMFLNFNVFFFCVKELILTSFIVSFKRYIFFSNNFCLYVKKYPKLFECFGIFNNGDTGYLDNEVFMELCMLFYFCIFKTLVELFFVFFI